jgi:hypothetical protein
MTKFLVVPDVISNGHAGAGLPFGVASIRSVVQSELQGDRSAVQVFPKNHATGDNEVKCLLFPRFFKTVEFNSQFLASESFTLG